MNNITSTEVLAAYEKLGIRAIQYMSEYEGQYACPLQALYLANRESETEDEIEFLKRYGKAHYRHGFVDGFDGYPGPKFKSELAMKGFEDGKAILAAVREKGLLFELTCN